MTISQYEAERWRQLCDELTGQAERIKASPMTTTRAEWQAVEAIQAASRQLFSAFTTIIREKEPAA